MEKRIKITEETFAQSNTGKTIVDLLKKGATIPENCWQKVVDLPEEYAIIYEYFQKARKHHDEFLINIFDRLSAKEIALLLLCGIIENGWNVMEITQDIRGLPNAKKINRILLECVNFYDNKLNDEPVYELISKVSPKTYRQFHNVYAQGMFQGLRRVHDDICARKRRDFKEQREVLAKILSALIISKTSAELAQK